MIASKLILFFCFCLLLLDTLLGRETILQQGGNKKLLKRAIEFGKCYGGDLGELGSQWKQLLIQLVQAKRKVGLGKYQLSRFNDSATEEVGLAIKDSYADKFAALVAIRTQDIGTTQKYVDDLEILKNEIALAMVVKMEKLEEKIKEKNVRKKVKEAKENGLSDTDIKEILFAYFFDSRGGSSLIRAGASIVYALLSSFLYGMERILDGTYYEKLGITEYVNGVPVGNNHPLAGGDSDPEEYVVPGSSGGSPGGAPGGGGSGGAPGGAPGGGGSGGPPTAPPTAPPTGEDVPDDSHEQDENEDEKEVKDPHKNLATFFQNHNPEIDLEEDIEGELAWEMSDLLPQNGDYNDAELAEAENIVQVHLEPIRSELVALERNLSRLEEEYANRYQRDPSLRAPNNVPLNRRERLALYSLRAAYFQSISNQLRQLTFRHLTIAVSSSAQYSVTRDNFNHYQGLVRQTSAPETTLPSIPRPLDDFADLSIPTDKMRYLVSALRWNDMILIRERLDRAQRTLEDFMMEVTRLRRLEEEKIHREARGLESPSGHRIG